MFWNETKIVYDILIPPITKKIQNLNEDEAKFYFEWYINQIPQRMEYLSRMSGCKLDKSFDSLVDLWAWFLKVAKIEKVSERKRAEIRKILKNMPKEYVDYVLSEEQEQLSLQTEYILRDIGMYVGEVFINYSDKIKWGYHTDVEKDSFANTPILQGFEDHNYDPPFQMIFEPSHMLSVQAANLFDKTQNKKDVYELCQHWVSFISK